MFKLSVRKRNIAIVACMTILGMPKNSAADDLAGKLSTPERIGETLAAIVWAEPRCTQLDYTKSNIDIVKRMGRSAWKSSAAQVAQGAERREQQLKTDWRALGPDGACIKLALTEPELFNLKQ